jgi:hypothetical protein
MKERRMLVSLDAEKVSPASLQSSLEKEHKLYFRRFDEDLILREVILGERSSVSQSRIEQLVNDLNVFVFKVRKANYY